VSVDAALLTGAVAKAADDVPSAAADPAQTAMVFTRDREAEVVIRQCLATLLPAAEFINGTVDAAIALLAQRVSPRLLIVDVAGSADPVERIRKLATVCEPGTGVIALGDTNDIRLYRELRLAGIVEYFFKPLVSTLVTRAAGSILKGGGEEPRVSSLGKLIVVIGVRGGSGATTIGASAAWHLAEVLQRRVALLDLDLFGGDAALQLDATPTHALCEALEHPERVDDLFLDRATIRVTERLSLLASLESLSSPMVPSETSVLSLLGKLLRRHRYVFVDLPLELASTLLRVLHLPGICLLISSQTLVGGRDLVRWRELVGPSSTERQVLHVLNKAGADGGLTQAEFLQAAGEEPAIEIPFDRAISIASSMGVKAVLKCATLEHGLAPLFSIIAGEPIQPKRSLADRIVARLFRRQ
jgi:pilus assembly protein CpaE